MEKTEFLAAVNSLSPEQYLLLSWLATKVNERGIRNSATLTQSIFDYENACRIIKVPYQLIYEVVINFMHTGLQNINRITYIDVFE